MEKKRILITGASGFIGSFIVEEALQRGFDVWAAVRHSSSRRYLTDARIHFIELDLDSESRLQQQLATVDGGFDYVVHAAGATKCLHSSDFYRINTAGTQHLVTALRALQTPLRRFVFVSSLSICGPVREQQPYTEMTEDDTPQPNTAYGRSKWQAEQWLDTLGQSFPYVVLRPTGVYGPRERDYYMQLKSISRHVDFAVGLRPQQLTFVYVADVVQAVFLALERGQVGRRYILSDGNAYTSRQFSQLVRQSLGVRWALRVTAPLWLLRVVTCCGELAGRLTGRMTALNNDKYNILRQRNWRCSIRRARQELGFRPQYDLQRGVAAAVKWYQENHWL